MPRPGKAEINTEPCEVCGKVIRYKADVPRHKRTHSKEAPTYRCPFEDCKYRNLQKSNVKTHIRTHTGEKPLSCPECDFRTSDPGSLTRHRKRRHDYVPKKAGHTGRVPAPKHGAKRHAPYSHSSSPRSSAPSPSSVASTSSLTSNRFLNLAILEKQVAAAYATLQSICGPSVPLVPSQNTLSFPWDKNFEVFSDKCLSPVPVCKAELDFTPNLCPPELVPAGHAGPQIAGFEGVPKTIAANPATFNTFLSSIIKSPTSAALPTTPASTSSTSVPASQPVYPIVQQQPATGTEAFWNRDYSVLASSPALTSSSSDSDFFTEPLSTSSSFSSPFSSGLFSFSDFQVPEAFIPSVKTGFETSEMHNLYCPTSPVTNLSDVFAYC